MRGCGQPYGWCKHREPDKLGEWDRCWKCWDKNMMPKLLEARKHKKGCDCYYCNPDDWSENLGKH